MKRKWFIIAVLFFFFLFAQQSSSRSSLHTIASLGVAVGESTAKPLMQITSGFYYKKWFTGLGAGLDLYNLKSIPLFVDYRFFFGKKYTCFLYADAGYNIPFGNKSDVEGYSKHKDRFYGGVYVDAGAGYRIALGDRHRILISAGYSRKDVFHNIEYVYGGGPDPGMEQEYNYHYMFGRIAARVNWDFGR